MRAALFATCLADSFLAESAMAAARVLRALGVEVVVPPDQTCCGQPAFNAGYWDPAREMAAHTLDVFRDADAVVLPSGSCAAMIRRHYVDLFQGADPSVPHPRPAASVPDLAARTWELTEFIVNVLGVTELGDGLHGVRVAWHHGCHALRELGVREEPLTLLRNAGAVIVDWEAADECCGFGGVFSVKIPEVSVAMTDRKIATLAIHPRVEGGGDGGRGRESGAGIDVLTSTDGGCLLQLAGRLRHRGIDLPVRHVADLLWEAMGGTGGGVAMDRPGSGRSP